MVVAGANFYNYGIIYLVLRIFEGIGYIDGVDKL